MKFCSDCGSDQIVLEVPEGDTRVRHICRQCGMIHYRNPNIICGTLPIWQDKILLCKRAIEPRKNYWTLPAGFMENSESVAQGALRETQEEACAEIATETLFSVISVPDVNQVHIFFKGDVINGQFSPGEESLETRLFALDEIPWEELAFRTVSLTLQYYQKDVLENTRRIHHGTILPDIPLPIV